MSSEVAQVGQGTAGSDDQVAPGISAHGRFGVFPYFANNLVPASTGAWEKVFVRGRGGKGA